MKVLLTRPERDSAAFAERLRENGIDALIAPLMSVEYVDGPPPDLANVQALLMTSANGVRAMARRSAARDLPVFAVGDATAREARTAGFRSVTSAGGDVGDLAERVRAACDPAGGALLHVAGTSVAGDLAGALEAGGYSYRRDVMYAARQVDRLPPAAADALDSDDLDGAALFSPRSAEILERCVAEAGRTPALARLRAFGLSRNVADALSAEKWREISVAAEPTADAMLKMVLAAAETR